MTDRLGAGITLLYDVSENPESLRQPTIRGTVAGFWGSTNCPMDMLQTLFLGNALKSWLLALGWAIGGILVARILCKVVGGQPVARPEPSNLDDLIVDKLEELWLPSPSSPCARATAN